jgi:hypothetical protein
VAAKKTARGRAQDRAKVAGGQKYEVSYEAKKTGRSAPAVKKAVKKVGNMRKKVEKRLAREKRCLGPPSFRGALRASVPDGLHDLPDLRLGGVRREATGRIVPGDLDGMVAGVGIGAVPGPPVIFAFVNCTSFVQHRYRPAAQRPGRGLSSRFL